MARSESAEATAGLGWRLLSAAVGLPLLILAVWAGTPLVASLAGLAALLGLAEFYGLTSRAGARPWALGGIAWAAAVITAAAVDGGRPTAILFGAGAGTTLAVMLVARRPLRSRLASWSVTLAGAVYVGLPLAYAVLLRRGTDGPEWLLLALLATFATDTGAYVVGRLLGRHPMAPSISPGKTWEGAVGGLLGGMGTAVALVALLEPPFVVWAAVALGGGIGLASQVGDLIESRLKRWAGAKEAGWVVPGHGGIMDRLDSLVFVFPLVYYVSRSWPET